MERLGENMRTLRKRWRMNQEEMGKRLGVIRSHYSKWEKGVVRLPLEAMFELSKLSGVPIEDFLTKRLEQEDFPLLPIGEGGSAVARPTAADAPGELGEFADLRKLVATVRELQTDMGLLKKLVGKLDEEGVRKLNLLLNIHPLILQLENEFGEDESSEERKKYLSALTALAKAGGDK